LFVVDYNFIPLRYPFHLHVRLSEKQERRKGP
jgi:hypothetical protein